MTDIDDREIEVEPKLWTGVMPTFSSWLEYHKWKEARSAEVAAYYDLHPEEEKAAEDAHYETDLDRTIKRIAYEEELQKLTSSERAKLIEDYTLEITNSEQRARQERIYGPTYSIENLTKRYAAYINKNSN